MSSPKPALGKGLGALIPGASRPLGASPAAVVAAEPQPGERIHELDVEQIKPNRFQPRRVFKEEELHELAETIKKHGLLQAVVVRRLGTAYELISGERRLRATQFLGEKRIRAVVREATDEQMAELALIENLQRAELNPIEEAEGYQRLIDTFKMRQEDVAERVGKSRAAVANMLRLLSLDPAVRGHVGTGQLSVGHAKVILGLDDAEKQRLAAEKVLLGGLNVRQTEGLVALLKNPGKAGRRKGAAAADVPVSSLVNQIESALRQKLGTKVHLKYSGGKGSIHLEYFSDDDLNRILDVLGISL